MVKLSEVLSWLKRSIVMNSLTENNTPRTRAGQDNKKQYKAKMKGSGFWSPRVSPQTSTSTFLVFYFICYETMSNCSQNCWIDWNSAVLCFKRPFHTGIMNVSQICAASLGYHTLCKWEIGPVPITTYSCIMYFNGLHRFWSWPMTRNRRLGLASDHYFTGTVAKEEKRAHTCTN